MKQGKFLSSFFIFILFFLYRDVLFSEIHFKNSDFELEIIRINGKTKGPTLLVFGGIHGDEEGGFSSAEVLSKIELFKGNLIIVPRVNFAGIMRYRREIFGDMNRKFITKDYPNDPDHKIIILLKKLISEADIFINQHDAFGFHRNKYISKTYNPFRYGQSLIVDTGKIYSNKSNTILDINSIGKRIIDNVNKEIKNKKHHFCFWNQNSISVNTKFKDMQKSATYYAVTRYSIPAFGLETSKNLPSPSLKVKYQLLVMKKIMDEFNFEYKLSINKFEKPKLYWIEFIKNEKDIIRVNSNTNIRLDKNDRIKVSKIYSNYKTGLSFDILGWKNLNDFNNEYLFIKERTAFLRKNNVYIGKVRFKYYKKDSLRKIFIEVNNKIISIPNWGVLKLSKDDSFKVLYADSKKHKFRFDIRGFNGKGRNDSNVLISKNDLLKKHSFHNKGKIYFVKIYKRSTFMGGFQIEFSQ